MAPRGRGDSSFQLVWGGWGDFERKAEASMVRKVYVSAAQ